MVLETVKKIEDTSLPVMEAFYTIQGEGHWQGYAAYFIRLGGCDVGCHWCDVKESWDVNAHPHISVNELVNNIKEVAGNIVVITGGEPLMHNLDQLTSAIQQAGKRTHIETSGAHKYSGTWDWFCLSPKKFKPTLQENYSKAHELKMVIYHPSDIAWAEKEAQKVNPDCKLFLQPEWDRTEIVMPLITEYIKANPKWRVSLQTHKFMQIP
jgi:organic radical activating enzyme